MSISRPPCPEIDRLSVASLAIECFAFSHPVGAATGFVVTHESLPFLITNYHVISGRHPATGEQLRELEAIPDRVLVALPRRTSGFWLPHVQRILRDDGSPLWCEHPDVGHRFDVVAIPLLVPPSSLPLPYALDPGPDLAIGMASDVAIIGFPEGMSGPGVTALWKSGSVASEPELLVDGDDFFWIDANTRKGMSGSPVVARRFGSGVMRGGPVVVGTSVIDRVLGVYAGRALEAPDMTLGRVWRWRGVASIVQDAVRQVRSGKLKGEACTLGYLSACDRDGEEPRVMIKIDQQPLKVRTSDPSGKATETIMTPARVIRDVLDRDQRFGTSLVRVRLAAQIEAACDQAEKEPGAGSLQLTKEQYQLVREAITEPQGWSWMPAVSRQLLPLLERIVGADSAGADSTISKS